MSMGELTVPAHQEQLKRVQDFVEEQIKTRLSPRITQHILLATEEVFINIARYAYPQGEGTADIVCTVGDSGIELTFMDEGIAYNPLTQEKPDTTLPADARPVGGLGIYLARELMDQMTYRYENGRNILCMCKGYGSRSNTVK